MQPTVCTFTYFITVIRDRAKAVNLQDEISTGLDSSTTFQIVRSLRDLVQLGSATAMIALLQPAPEVFVSALSHSSLQDGSPILTAA